MYIGTNVAMLTEVYTCLSGKRFFIDVLHIPREIYNRRYPSPSTIFKNRSFHPTPPLYTVLYHHSFNSETDLTLFRIINRVVFKRECM